MSQENEFAQRLRVLRKKAGLSQETLGGLLGTSYMTIRRWEAGKRSPRMEEIKRIAEALNVTEAELLNGQSEMNWELKLIFRKEGEVKGGTIDMSGNTITTALTVGDRAISLELGAPIELWEDDAKFEGLIDQLRKRRVAGLKTRKEGW